LDLSKYEYLKIIYPKAEMQWLPEKEHAMPDKEVNFLMNKMDLLPAILIMVGLLDKV
jgi:hypothetical protein